MVACGACGTQNPEGFNFCGKCAAPLQAARPVAQERKVVTSLFCDLVAFTAMSEAADPEDVDAILGRYFAAARGAIESFGGTVEKFIGDAVVGVFGVPAAHEDDPERAVRAGLRLVEAVEGLTRPDGSPLQLRVGINTGEALVRLDVTPGSGEGFLTGDAVNTAARIQSVAPVMGVAVGRSTFEATGPVFDYAELSPAVVKGKTDPVEVWHAVAPLARFGTDVTRRHDTPMVGREIDLALLKGVFDKTVAAQAPQLVTIVGEPGLGKSRLVAEMFGHIDSQPGLVTWRQGRCLPYGDGITFWALGEIVKAHAGIFDTDAADVAEKKVDAVLPDVEERAWLKQRLLPLLGIEASSSAEQGELFTAWRRFLESIAEDHPTVLVFEDLHWADTALLAFVEHLASNAEGVPLLIVGTARPELYERHPDYGRGLRNTTTVNLTPLTEAETTRLVGSLLQTVAVPDDLRLPLVERASGNPLFAEEYVRLLQDQELIEHVDEHVRLRPGAELPLPDSVQALIAARLDTLPPDRKALLADAAVVGKTFWAGAVASMSDMTEGEVVEVMRELSRKELIRSVRSSSMAGQTEYSFWHVLTRDVAYAQLPRASRAGRHMSAAQWIEGQAGNRVEDHADILAYHYTTAMDLTRVVGDEELADLIRPSALRFLLLAGERAVGLNAPAASAHLGRALAMAEPGDPVRARILAANGLALHFTGHLPEAQEALEEAVDLLIAAGDIPAAVNRLGALSIVLRHRGNARWLGIADQMLTLTASLPASPVQIPVYAQLCFCEGVAGNYEASVDYANRALELADQLGLPKPGRVLGYRGLFRSDAGDQGGIDDFYEAIDLATAAGEGRDAGIMYSNLAISVAAFQGPAAAMKVLEAGIAYTDARGLSEPRDSVASLGVQYLVYLGQLEQALSLAEEFVPQFQAGDRQLNLSDVRDAQTLALLLRGEPDQTLDWLDWLVACSRDIGQPRAGLGRAACAHAVHGNDDVAVEMFTEMVTEPGGSMVDLPPQVRCLINLDRLDIAEDLVANEPSTIPASRHGRVAALAALTEAKGDYLKAVAGYAEAAERWHDFTMYVEEAFALLGQGRCLIKLNRPEEAVPVLTTAREMFAKMGARPALAETESLLAPLT